MRIPTQEETDELKKEVEKDLYESNYLLNRMMRKKDQRRVWGRPS